MVQSRLEMRWSTEGARKSWSVLNKAQAGSVEVEAIVGSELTLLILAIPAIPATLAAGEGGRLDLETCGPEARAPRTASAAARRPRSEEHSSLIKADR